MGLALLSAADRKEVVAAALIAARFSTDELARYNAACARIGPQVVDGDPMVRAQIIMGIVAERDVAKDLPTPEHPRSHVGGPWQINFHEIAPPGWNVNPPGPVSTWSTWHVLVPAVGDHFFKRRHPGGAFSEFVVKRRSVRYFTDGTIEAIDLDVMTAQIQEPAGRGGHATKPFSMSCVVGDPAKKPSSLAEVAAKHVGARVEAAVADVAGPVVMGDDTEPVKLEPVEDDGDVTMPPSVPTSFFGEPTNPPPMVRPFDDDHPVIKVGDPVSCSGEWSEE